MARIRTIKPETFTSESIAALTLPARWTFVGLWTFVDDKGRSPDNAKILRGAIWPNDEDTVSSRHVERHLDELESHDMVCRYESGGRRYLHVVNFEKHQRINRPTESKLPPCDFHDLGGWREALGELREVSPQGPDSSSTPHSQLSEGSGNVSSGTNSTNSRASDGRLTPSGTSEGSASDDRLTHDGKFPPSGSDPLGAPEHPGQHTSPTPHPQLTEDSLRTRGRAHAGSGSGSGSGSGTTSSSASPPSEQSATPRSRKAKDQPEHPRFAEFWDAYGHKVGRPDAKKAFNEAIAGGADPDILIGAAGRYARHCKRLRLTRDRIKHPSGWLNGERWLDDLGPDEDTPPGTAIDARGQPTRPSGVARAMADGAERHDRMRALDEAAAGQNPPSPFDMLPIPGSLR